MVTQNQINQVIVGAPVIQADNFNRIVDSVNRLNNLSFDPATMEYYSDDGVNIMAIPAGGGTVDSVAKAFECTVSGDTVTVEEGTYTEHGAASDDYAGGEVTLSGGPYEYVFAVWDRSGKSIDVNHATSMPTSDGETVYVGLAKFELISAGVYSKVLIKHEGDINFDLPLA